MDFAWSTTLIDFKQLYVGYNGAVNFVTIIKSSQLRIRLCRQKGEHDNHTKNPPEIPLLNNSLQRH